MAETSTDLPRLVLEDDRSLHRILSRLRMWLWRYPDLARSLVRLLVSEGRRFADTPEGARWQARLADAPLTQRGRMIWSAYGLDRLLDDQAAPPPSDWLEALATTLEETDLEQTLAAMMMEEARHATFDSP